jgi:membrane associated rhomboid family serine protease
VIPLRDDVPSRTYPIVNVLLIIANVLVFLFEITLGDSLDSFISAYALIPARFTDGGTTSLPLDPAAYPPIFASMFLHGGLMHVGGNMLYLWVFGDNVEDRLGHLGYVFFYLACGVLAALTHVAIDPTSEIPMVGASGAIAGVLGAYMILYPRGRVLTLIPIVIIPWFVQIPAVFFLGVWFLGQVWSGGMYLHATEAARGGVAVMAHVGGFIAGVVLCLLMKKPERPILAPRSYWLHD